MIKRQSSPVEFESISKNIAFESENDNVRGQTKAVVQLPFHESSASDVNVNDTGQPQSQVNTVTRPGPDEQVTELRQANLTTQIQQNLSPETEIPVTQADNPNIVDHNPDPTTSQNNELMDLQRSESESEFKVDLNQVQTEDDIESCTMDRIITTVDGTVGPGNSIDQTVPNSKLYQSRGSDQFADEPRFNLDSDLKDLAHSGASSSDSKQKTRSRRDIDNHNGQKARFKAQYALTGADSQGSESNIKIQKPYFQESDQMVTRLESTVSSKPIKVDVVPESQSSKKSSIQSQTNGNTKNSFDEIYQMTLSIADIRKSTNQSNTILSRETESTDIDKNAQSLRGLNIAHMIDNDIQQAEKLQDQIKNRNDANGIDTGSITQLQQVPMLEQSWSTTDLDRLLSFIPDNKEDLDRFLERQSQIHAEENMALLLRRSTWLTEQSMERQRGFENRIEETENLSKSNESDSYRFSYNQMTDPLSPVIESEISSMSSNTNRQSLTYLLGKMLPQAVDQLHTDLVGNKKQIQKRKFFELVANQSNQEQYQMQPGTVEGDNDNLDLDSLHNTHKQKLQNIMDALKNQMQQNSIKDIKYDIVVTPPSNKNDDPEYDSESEVDNHNGHFATEDIVGPENVLLESEPESDIADDNHIMIDHLHDLKSKLPFHSHVESRNKVRFSLYDLEKKLSKTQNTQNPQQNVVQSLNQNQNLAQDGIQLEQADKFLSVVSTNTDADSNFNPSNQDSQGQNQNRQTSQNLKPNRNRRKSSKIQKALHQQQQSESSDQIHGQTTFDSQYRHCMGQLLTLSHAKHTIMEMADSTDSKIQQKSNLNSSTTTSRLKQIRTKTQDQVLRASAAETAVTQPSVDDLQLLTQQALDKITKDQVSIIDEIKYLERMNKKYVKSKINQKPQKSIFSKFSHEKQVVVRALFDDIDDRNSKEILNSMYEKDSLNNSLEKTQTQIQTDANHHGEISSDSDIKLVNSSQSISKSSTEGQTQANNDILSQLESSPNLVDRERIVIPTQPEPNLSDSVVTVCGIVNNTTSKSTTTVTPQNQNQIQNHVRNQNQIQNTIPNQTKIQNQIVNQNHQTDSSPDDNINLLAPRGSGILIVNLDTAEGRSNTGIEMKKLIKRGALDGNVTVKSDSVEPGFNKHNNVKR